MLQRKLTADSISGFGWICDGVFCVCVVGSDFKVESDSVL